MPDNPLDLPPMPDLPPDATLITGPVGCGKTEAAVDAILAARDLSAFAPIWVLLPTAEQIDAFRDRLVRRSLDGVLFGVEFFSFYSLYARLLHLAGDPQRVVDHTARYHIARHIAVTLRDAGQLELFGEIAHLPGFAGLIVALFDELKEALVRPEQFAQVAAARGPKDRDLARLYAAYQQFLIDRRLVDRHGAGWLAVEHLRQNPRLAAGVNLLVVDGFDQFNTVHVTLLTLLARQTGQTVLTLTRVPGEQGRRFRRFEQTRQRLLEAAAPDPAGLWREQPLAAPERMPASTLDHLPGALFHHPPAALPDDGTVRLLEAPDPLREVQAVLRRVKRLLLNGVNPESIAVVARRLDRYSSPLRETAHAYGIPLVVRQELALADNPAVASLLALIDLAALDFPRREVIDTLRSPYFVPPDFSPAQIAQLERLSLERQIVRGRATWIDTAAKAVTPQVDEDGEAGPALGADTVGALVVALIQHFDRITPPAQATAAEFAAWITALIGPDPAAAAEDRLEALDEIADEAGGSGAVSQIVGDLLNDKDYLPDAVLPPDHFNLLGCIRAAPDAAQVARDVVAVHGLLRVLRDLCAAHALLDAGHAPARLEWADFRAELELAVRRATLVPSGGFNRLGRVLATDVLEARGLPHDHVFLLGLAEGEFPCQEPGETLYQDGERRALAAQGIPLLTTAERSDDLSLFYQMVGLARQTLTVSRYTVDDRAMPRPPSAYWAALRAAVAVPDEQIARLKIGAPPTLDDVATFDEAAVAVAAVLSGEVPGIPAVAAHAVHNALLIHPLWRASWLNVLRGRRIEARREDAAQRFDRYSGVLSEPLLIEQAAAALGPDRLWSASQFTEYGVCPFRFFARRLLRLEELREPEEGLDALRIGLINHAILELTYGRLAADGLFIAPENQARVLEFFEMLAAEVFEAAPEKFGFRPTPVWAYEQIGLARLLRGLIQLDFSDDSPFVLRDRQKAEHHPLAARLDNAPREPLRQEAYFGMYGEPPLILDGPAGPLRVRGVIDRLDQAGDYLVVVDYKSGSTPHPTADMAAGRDFQMMIYLRAARALAQRWGLPLEVAGGLFWHIRTRAVSGEVSADDPAIEMAHARLHEFILAARSGWFAARPRKVSGGRCAVHCEFGALCRVTRGALRKPES